MSGGRGSAASLASAGTLDDVKSKGFVQCGVSTGIALRYDDPREIGPDRIVNAVAARESYGVPVIVVDFG